LKDDSLVNCRSKHKLIDEDKNVKEPKEGMLFGSIEELLEHYRNYAKQEGFGVVQKKKKKYENRDVHFITLACARQGNASSSSSNSLCKPMKISKTGCNATLSATLVDTMWYVTNVKLRHNHDLSPGKARYIRCHKKLDLATKRKLDIDDRAGVHTNKIYNSLVVEAGGYENLIFGEKECRNYIANSRSLRLGTGGATTLRDYFDRMRKVDSDFYFEMDVDDEFRLKNVFWADARSKASYEDFGDVITFDTTYLTNKYEMPFAPFVGVNHLGQSILFRAALISSEDTTTFTWLFEAWLKCMKGRAPRAIITNQDMAMKNVIKRVFPVTRHRFCLWHILKKFQKNLDHMHSTKPLRMSYGIVCIILIHVASLMLIGRVYLSVIIWRRMHGCMIYTTNRLSGYRHI
jgi:hypothetical protein